MGGQHRALELGLGALLIMGGANAVPLDPAAAGADPLQVEPRVPRASGTPCVVELMRDERIPAMSVFGNTFSYTPPAGCLGAWAKVKLVIELNGPRQNGNPVSALSLHFSDVNDPTSGTPGAALWAGAPQTTDGIPRWRVERDITEYATLLRQPHGGVLSGRYDNFNQDFDDLLETPTATALLVFYPASARTPAQRVADVVLPVAGFDPHFHLPVATYSGAFPRNIERAYLDVISHPSGEDMVGQSRYWYACAPNAVLAEFPYLQNSFAIGDQRHNFVSFMQGCGNGSYREVEIRIDGRLAGLAPVFPWLGSSLSNNFRNTVDTPAPAAQALNWMPFRVDLTPFAGLLNNGAAHTVEARLLGAESGLVSGHLVLYLDKARAVVPGAVTSNTLTASTPAVTDTLVETVVPGEIEGRRVAGTVETRSVRSFRIAGYVDTSRGRIASTVQQRNYFVNRNVYDVTAIGPVELWEFFTIDHDQKVRLTSAVDVTSRRVLGTTLLSEDKSYTAYPFTLDYRNAGEHRSEDEFSFALPEEFSALVHQARVQRTSQFRRGTSTRYETSLVDVFDGSKEFVAPEEFFNWGSTRDYRFTDNRGGCYSASLTTMDGLLETRTRGDDCPNGTNALRWWSHPDGSPDSMNWAPAP